MQDKKQLNVRLSQESISQLGSIVNFYRAQYPIGRIARDTVLEEIIKMCYDQMKKTQQTKGKSVFVPTLEGPKEKKEIAGSYRTS